MRTLQELASDLVGRALPTLGIESARGNDGFGITVSYWADEASARAWGRVAEHVGW